MNPEQFPRNYSEADVAELGRTREVLLSAGHVNGFVDIENMLKSDDPNARRLNVAAALSLVQDGKLVVDTVDPLKLQLTDTR